MRSLINNAKKHVMELSRRRKLEQFYSGYSGGKVLDAGVSGSARIEGENIFLSTFSERPELYTGLGVEDLSALAKYYTKSDFITYDGRYFPFDDNEFEWVFSNAVIEHVGDFDDQLLFLNEMLRVGSNVFFTTPNRWFPIESHTNAVFRHWLPNQHFYNWCSRKQLYWNRQNLKLLDYDAVRLLMEASTADNYQIIKNRFCGLVMTFSIVCSSNT